MKFKHNDNKGYSKIKKHYESIIDEKEDNINMLNSVLSEKNLIISRTKSYLFDLESDFNDVNTKVNSLKADLAKNKMELDSKEKQISNMESELASNKNTINNLNNQLNSLKNVESRYYHQLDAKEYCICCYKEKINDNNLEIEYLKKNSFIRKLLNPLSYLYLLFKSSPNEISINFKLYKSLKDSQCFDVGYYLNKNTDLIESKWCKFFSPQLHYVCKGFNEQRKFNKKYFNRNSKKELLDYLNECGH